MIANRSAVLKAKKCEFQLNCSTVDEMMDVSTSASDDGVAGWFVFMNFVMRYCASGVVIICKLHIAPSHFHQNLICNFQFQLLVGQILI